MVLAFQNQKAGVTWQELLAQDVAVILGGAGSGKTSEILQQAAKLRESGTPAFVLRLEALCRQPLNQSFFLEDDSAAHFKVWQQKGGRAVVFLDALDEARLPEARNASVIKDAMARFSEGVGRLGSSLNFVITTRPSEWHGQSDLDLIKTAVSQLRTSSKNESPKVSVKVFRIASLDIEDCRSIANSREVDAEKFITQVNHSLSADLLGQPLDVQFLLDVWISETADSKRPEHILSSKLEVYEKVVTFRIRVEGAGEKRSNIDPIASRLACEKLAAAALLTGIRDFRAESQELGTLDATRILATDLDRWREVETRQLLSCGLFQPSVGGRVRFAHRQIEDYLSACFFNRAVDRSAGSLDVVEPLTASGLGAKQIPQSTEQVIGWLATINPQARRLVNSIRPSLLIESGDPTRLTDIEKANALQSQVSLYNDRKYRGEWFQRSDLKKFSNPEIALAVKKLLPEAKSPEVRAFLVEVARFGQMKSLSSELAAIATNPDEPLAVRTEACSALAEFGDNQFAQELILSVFATKQPDDDNHYGAPNWNSFLVAFLIYAYPTSTTSLEAIAVLSKFVREPRNYSSMTSQYVLDFVEKQTDCASWLAILLRFASSRTREGHDLLPSAIEKYRVFAPAICRLTIELMKTPLDEIEKSLALDGVEYMCRIDDITGIIKWRTPFADLAGALKSNSALKAAFVDRRIRLFPHSDNFHNIVYHAIEPIEFGRDEDAHPIFTLEDVAHYCEKMRTTSDDQQKSIAFEIASHLSQKIQGKNERQLAHTLLRKSSKRWGNAYSKDRHPHGLKNWILRRKYRFQHIHKYTIERKFKVCWDWVIDFYWRFRQAGSFWRKRREIKNANDLNKLLWVAKFAHSDSGEKTIDWTLKRYGSTVAKWFEIGFKNFWRKHVLAEQERGTYIASVGLVGLSLEAAHGGIACNNSEEVKNAFRFSFSNLNGFPNWLPSLMRQYQSDFVQISDELISSVWDTGHAQGEFPAEPLSKIAYSSYEVRNAIAPLLLAKLKQRKPSKTPDFEIVIGIVSKSQSTDASQIIPLLRKGFKESVAQFDFAAAWIWLDGLFNLDAKLGWDEVVDFLGDTWHEAAASLWISYIGRDPRSFSKAEERQFERDDLASNAVVLGKLVRASYIAFPPDKDPYHEEVYSPGQKDRAADCRRYFLNALGQIGSAEALAVLDELSGDKALKPHRDTFLFERDKLVRNSARRPTFDFPTAIGWLNTFTKPPSSVDEFRTLLRRHIKALLNQLKNSDDDEGSFFRRGVATEDDLRNWLSARLRAIGRDWYEVIREQEVAADKRPDLRVHARQADLGRISIEIKLADMSWKGDVLVDKIKTQLVDQYMHENGSHTGIYLVLNAASPQTRILDKRGNVLKSAFSKTVGSKKMNFEKLVNALEAKATLEQENLGANKVVCVEAIDLMAK